jgi:cytochrome c oxidase cbb3-type subunit 3
VSNGAVLFQANCAACHGEDAEGLEGIGAANLTDEDWIYGGDARTVRLRLLNGRQGIMPARGARLSAAEIRMFALYVEGLSAKGAKGAR